MNFFFKKRTASGMLSSDWSSDVFSSDLAQSFQVQSKRTQPPAHFTGGTLIQAMAHVHRFVTDPAVKKHLREKDGLGTEATRAAILEKLAIGRASSRERVCKYV